MNLSWLLLWAPMGRRRTWSRIDYADCSVGIHRVPAAWWIALRSWPPWTNLGHSYRNQRDRWTLVGSYSSLQVRKGLRSFFVIKSHSQRNRVYRIPENLSSNWYWKRLLYLLREFLLNFFRILISDYQSISSGFNPSRNCSDVRSPRATAAFSKARSLALCAIFASGAAAFS